MLGRSSGNHDWLLANASACVSCGLVFVYAKHATQAIAFEWKPGFRLWLDALGTMANAIPLLDMSVMLISSNGTAFTFTFNLLRLHTQYNLSVLLNFICWFIGENEFKLPLWFGPGNRYEVTVSGYQPDGEVVCKKSIEFRTGEGLYVCLLICKSIANVWHCGIFFIRNSLSNV